MLKVKNYNMFESVVGKLKSQIQPIYMGEEFIYERDLKLLEIRLLELHNSYGINGRKTLEIIQLVLYDIKGILENEEYDCSKFEEENYRICADEIEKLFIPDKNPTLKKELGKDVKLYMEYFEITLAVLIRVYESISLHTRKDGLNGYYDFIKDYIYF